MTRQALPRSSAGQPVTVVIPHYESYDTLLRALLSVLGQTTPPAEVLVVDDGSVNATQERVASLVSSLKGVDARAILLPENRGPATARNAGWDAATQPLIAFLDADDTWHPQKLELQTPVLLRREYDFVTHPLVVARPDKFTKADEVPLSRIPNVERIPPRAWLWRNRTSTPAVMLRNDTKLRFDVSMRYAEDYELWLRMAFSGISMGRLPVPLGYLHKSRYGADGLSAALWRMELGELTALWRLVSDDVISPMSYGLATGISIGKYVRRLAKVAFRPLGQHYS